MLWIEGKQMVHAHQEESYDRTALQQITSLSPSDLS
jgi:hypothetical protein